MVVAATTAALNPSVDGRWEDRGQCRVISGALNLARSAPAAQASYRYRWDCLDYRTFHHQGVIARRAPDGTPRFNFPQTVWLFPKVRMNWAGRMNDAVLTLAVNVLTPLLAEQDVIAYFGVTSQRALRAANDFARLFLCSMPRTGGCIPMDVLREWIHEEI